MKKKLKKQLRKETNKKVIINKTLDLYFNKLNINRERNVQNEINVYEN